MFALFPECEQGSTYPGHLSKTEDRTERITEKLRAQPLDFFSYASQHILFIVEASLSGFGFTSN